MVADERNTANIQASPVRVETWNRAQSDDTVSNGTRWHGEQNFLDHELLMAITYLAVLRYLPFLCIHLAVVDCRYALPFDARNHKPPPHAVQCALTVRAGNAD
jgi:hypothetical protein